MSGHHIFGEFKPSEETWACYIERLDAYFVTNDVTEEEKKRSFLISVVGPKTYGLMRNLVSPDKPKDVQFDVLTSAVQDHHHPRPSAIVQRYKFNTCFRQPGQTIGGYVADLRQIAEFCDYGEELENNLRDRLVCGVADDRIQWRLLSETNLNYKRALEIAQGMEMAAKKISDIQPQEQGEIQNMVGKIYVDPDAKPIFFKPRPLPFAMKEKVDAELDRLIDQGIISPVQHSDWATPIVPVLKGDNSVRLCGDYKVTINRVCQQDPYPIPRIEDLYARLSGGQRFTKIDLTSAFLQLPIDEQSKKYTTINTHRGLFQFNRLPFGIKSAPGIFQRCMDNLLQGINMTGSYQDDIITTGANDKQHLQNVTLSSASSQRLELE
ncbi:uncharacterized protein [Haliotis asinina]|uniref:uncharacterized protein n=1 Tax=Haliotis asinina TaxID=109174 RepID=UPI0035321897